MRYYFNSFCFSDRSFPAPSFAKLIFFSSKGMAGITAQNYGTKTNRKPRLLP